jgi:hypothetical protein
LNRAKAIALALTLGAAIAGPNAKADNIMDLIQTDLKFCDEQKLLNGFLQAKGPLHSGNPEIWIVDYGKLSRAGSTRNYCGSAGCLTQVFVYRQESGKYEKILDSNARDYRFVRVNG